MHSVVGQAPSRHKILQRLRAGAGEVYNARNTLLKRVIASRVIFLPFVPIPAPKNVPTFMPKLMTRLSPPRYTLFKG